MEQVVREIEMMNIDARIKELDYRISDLLGLRMICFRAPMETCNRINDEITALRIERVKMVREEGETE